MKLLRNLLFTGIILAGLLYFFSPRLFAQAGNSAINAINDSAASGLAQYLPTGIDGTMNDLQLKMSGLTSKFTYFVTLDTGSCGGSPMTDLGKFSSDSSGNLDANVSPGNLNTGQALYIDVHQGDTNTGQSVACGQLQINNHTLSGLDLSGTTASSNSQLNVNLGPSTSQGTGQSSGVSAPQSRPQAGFPNTGVAPAGSDSYDNYTFPRKY
jgi:hypothetical protein